MQPTDRVAKLMRSTDQPVLPLRRLARLVRTGAADLAAALEKDPRFRLVRPEPTLGTHPLAAVGASRYTAALEAIGLAGAPLVVLIEASDAAAPALTSLVADTMVRLLALADPGGNADQLTAAFAHSMAALPPSDCARCAPAPPSTSPPPRPRPRA